MTNIHALLRQPNTVLLQTARFDEENRRSLLFAEPIGVLKAFSMPEVQALLEALDGCVAAGYYAAGYLNYECGYAFESIGRVDSSVFPIAWFGVYREPVVFDTESPSLAQPDSDFEIAEVSFSLDPDTYADSIQTIKQYIRDGDVYQVNYTGTFRFELKGSLLACYEALKARQRVSYGAYIQTEDTTVLSLSPELFFRREGDRIWTRPMKGTVRRGRRPEEDHHLQQWLSTDEKSRAENVMIVDLLRNDLSVVCKPGTVRVLDLFTTEVYETLIQMTSTVEGTLHKGIRYADIFKALFPCGSVTGAPKIRAMQIIDQLEDRPRGLYTGAIGFIGPNEQALFNVAIRTLVVRDGRGEMGSGGGIVWDSSPKAEYDECLLKARFLTQKQEVFSLIESLLWDGALYPLLDRHLARLKGSASYFRYPLDEDRLLEQLMDCGEEAKGRRCKVRVLLDRQGSLTVQQQPITEAGSRKKRVTLSSIQIDADDPFFYHKTTRRALYDASYAEAVETGFDEVLFLNQSGALTEGSRSNLFIRKGNCFYTPPVSSGLLPGVYRSYLLETLPRVYEEVLTLDDLLCADAVFICNTVRGMQEAEIILNEAFIRSIEQSEYIDLNRS